MRDVIITTLAACSILYVATVTAFVFVCIFFVQANPLSIYWGIVDNTRFDVIAPIYWVIAYLGAFSLSLHTIKAD